MNPTSSSTPAAAAATAKPRRVKQTGGPGLTQDSSPPARRIAAAILEVLAGARTPQQAAMALAVSVPRYYQLESRALHAVVVACEARPHRGRVRSPASELARLKQDNAQLQREVTRQQALVRAAQRTLGLAPPAAPPSPASGKKTRRRKPVARALSVAARLQQYSAPPNTAPPTTDN